MPLCSPPVWHCSAVDIRFGWLRRAMGQIGRIRQQPQESTLLSVLLRFTTITLLYPTTWLFDPPPLSPHRQRQATASTMWCGRCKPKAPAREMRSSTGRRRRKPTSSTALSRWGSDYILAMLWCLVEAVMTLQAEREREAERKRQEAREREVSSAAEGVSQRCGQGWLSLPNGWQFSILIMTDYTPSLRRGHRGDRKLKRRRSWDQGLLQVGEGMWWWCCRHHMQELAIYSR